MLSRTLAFGLLVCLIVPLAAQVVPRVWAQDEAPAVNPYAVGEDASLDELVRFVHVAERKPDVIRKRPPFQAALVDASQRILDHADATDEQRLEAIDGLFASLSGLAAGGDADAKTKLNALANRFAEDERPAVRSEAQRVLLVEAERNADLTKAEVCAELLDKMRAYFEATPELTERHRDLVSASIRVMNKLPDQVAAAEAYLELGEKFSEAEDREIAKAGRQVSNFGKEYMLKLKPVELAGTLITGEALKPADYQDKVTLVYFWTVNCPPCRAELPNLKAQYEAYHDKGFEIISVCLDDDRTMVEEYIDEADIAWPVLFSENEAEAGGNNPLAQKFSVKGTPTAILLGRDSKIITKRARGPALKEALERLLPADPAS